MKKLIFVFLFLCLTLQKAYADNTNKLPIIKQLDKKYLNLIDKNGKITNLKEFNKNGKVLVFEDEDKHRKYLFISKIYNNQNKKYFLDGDYLYNALDFFIVSYCGEPLDDQLIAIINIDNFTYKNKDITEFSDKQWLLFNNWMQNRYTENPQIDFVDIILDFDGLNFFNKKKEEQIKKLLNISE